LPAILAAIGPPRIGKKRRMARMDRPPIYFDHNATTPIDPQVAEAMQRAWRDFYGNPASPHAIGRRARRALEEARLSIASALGAKISGMDADRVIFTSGGTEANNLAMFGLAANSSSRCAVISAIEHPSIMAPAAQLRVAGWNIPLAPVNADGQVVIGQLENLLANRPQFVSIMLANNETGVIQPIEEIAPLCQQHQALLHVDAVQAAGKMPVHFRELGAAAMTIAPHKFHGPVGIGALLVRSDVKLLPQLFGGFQQAAERPGTESVALAIGFARALEIWQQEAAERETRLRTLGDQLESALAQELPDMIVIGQRAPRLPHVSNVAFPGVNRQALMIALDLAGVLCSTGSACASGSSQPSPALLAMGLASDVVEGSIRLSLGAFTTADEVAEGSQRIINAVKHLRSAKKG
jgi:cysteine desulfurase